MARISGHMFPRSRTPAMTVLEVQNLGSMMPLLWLLSWCEMCTSLHQTWKMRLVPNKKVGLRREAIQYKRLAEIFGDISPLA